MRARLLALVCVAGGAALVAAGWLVDPALGLCVFGVLALAAGLLMDDGSGDETA